MTTPVDEPQPLRASSQALLAAYRDARPMPTASRDRVWAAVREPGRSAAATWLWAGVGAAAAALLLLGLAQLGGSTATEETSGPAVQAPNEAVPRSESASTQRKQATPNIAEQPDEPVVPDAPLEEATEPPTAMPAVSAVPTPATGPAPRKRRPRADKPAAAASPVSTLAEENRLIAEAWRHVASKRFAKARQATDTHARRFGKGVLAPERRAIAVIIDCLTDAPNATASAKRFISSKGGSVLVKKVREACGEKK